MIGQYRKKCSLAGSGLQALSVKED